MNECVAQHLQQAPMKLPQIQVTGQHHNWKMVKLRSRCFHSAVRTADLSHQATVLLSDRIDSV